MELSVAGNRAPWLVQFEMVLTVIVTVDVLTGLREHVRRARVVLVVQVHISDGVGGAGPRPLPLPVNFVRCSAFWVVRHEHRGETVVRSFALHVSVVFAMHVGLICASIMLFLSNSSIRVTILMFVTAFTGAGAGAGTGTAMSLLLVFFLLFLLLLFLYFYLLFFLLHFLIFFLFQFHASPVCVHFVCFRELDRLAR
jgi:hypothetical protein